nr:HK97 gp10 family phage protein [Sporolactobacillus sp. STSJ-5]
MSEYSDEVEDKLNKDKDNISKEAVSELKAASPTRTGDYAKNWARKKTAFGYVVYNRAPTYRLTHLLERGHMNRDGSRTAPRVHIAPVEEKVIDNFTKAAEKAVKG